MKRSKTKLLQPAPLVLAVLLASVSATAGDVVLIAHPELSIDAVSPDEVKRLFLGTSNKLAGTRVTLATLSEGATHEAFLKSWVSRTPQQFVSHWRKIVFSGKGKMPASLGSEAEMLEFVAATEGAIGYVSTSTRPVGVRVLEVR